jgi:hypothetical protein
MPARCTADGVKRQYDQQTTPVTALKKALGQLRFVAAAIAAESARLSTPRPHRRACRWHGLSARSTCRSTLRSTSLHPTRDTRPAESENAMFTGLSELIQLDRPDLVI